MAEINPEVFIRRNKLRRIFDQEFKKINDNLKAACKREGVVCFHIKYSSHLLDRAIQREIDEQYVFTLFNKLSNHVTEVATYLSLPQQPEVESKLEDDKVYRPLRLEITDQNLWLGMTVNKHSDTEKVSDYGLCCRMAFVNNKRLKGKTSTEVIYL